jgi:hypothetical protein
MDKSRMKGEDANDRPRANHGNWQQQSSRNFRELLSTRIEQMLLTEETQFEETATQRMGRLKNSSFRQRSMPIFSQLRCLMVS